MGPPTFSVNSPDVGGFLSTYGGAPRTMYGGIAAFTRLFAHAPEAVLRMLEEGR
jgi:hypothetical protein